MEETLCGDAFTQVVYIKTLLLSPNTVSLSLLFNPVSSCSPVSRQAVLTSPDKAKHSQEEPSVRMELQVLPNLLCSIGWIGWMEESHNKVTFVNL